MTLMAKKGLARWQKEDAARLRAIWLTAKSESGISQEDVCERMGWTSQSAFSQYVNGYIALNLNAVIGLAQVFGCTVADISPHYAAQLARVMGEPSDVFEVIGDYSAAHLQRYPLITWEQLEESGFSVQSMSATDVSRWIPNSTEAELSDQAFALRLKDDSMSAAGSPFNPGVGIWVEPELADRVVAGDFVIAAIPSRNRGTFRQLAEDAGRLFLKPLNPMYPAIHEDFRVLGKVISYFGEV